MFRLPGFILRSLTYNVERRFISTSNKSGKATSVTSGESAAKSSNEPVNKTKNWVSYGFDVESKIDDRKATHSTFFVGVTLCLVGCGYYLMYLPDYQLRDWAQREAFIELRRRELAGLPAIDPNLIDPSKIVLPTDEELGDTEIII